MTPTPGRIALTDPDLEDPRWPWAEMRADGLETTLFLKTSDLAALLNSVNQAWLPLGPPFSWGSWSPRTTAAWLVGSMAHSSAHTLTHLSPVGIAEAHSS